MYLEVLLDSSLLLSNPSYFWGVTEVLFVCVIKCQKAFSVHWKAQN